MLILRSQTLIPRTRDVLVGPLRLRQDDASEIGGACLTVIFTT